MRVVLGIVLGILMISLGQLMGRREKYRQYSLILAGGGLGIIYLSLYGAFNYYHLIPQVWALILMIGTTVGGFWLALREKSKGLAITAHVGGLLTPLLLMDGGFNSILVVYTIILNLAFWAIYLHKEWEALYVVNWIGTWVIIWAWLFNHDHAPLVGRLLGVSALFLLMMLPAIVLTIVKKKSVSRASLAVISMNTVWYAVAIGWLTGYEAGWSSPATGGLFAALAIVHIIFGYVVQSEHPEDRGAQSMLFALGIIIFVALATPLLLENLNEVWLVLAWLVEGLVLLSIGFRHASYVARNFGLITLALGAVYGFMEFGFDYRGSFVLMNGSFAALAGVAIALFVASFWYRHYKALLSPAEEGVATVLRFCAHGLSLFVISRECIEYINNLENVTRSTIVNLQRFGLSILWALYASFAMLLGMLRHVRVDRLFATMLFTVVIIKVFLYDSAQLSEIYRIVSFISLGAILLIISYLIYRYKDEIKEFLADEQVA